MPQERYIHAAVAIASNLAGEGAGSVTGSGCLIAGGFVLTARHVVAPEGASGPVRLRFHPTRREGDDGAANRPSGFVDAVTSDDAPRGIVWSCEKRDLALVKCDPPDGIPALRLARTELRLDEVWTVGAFPKLDREDWTEILTFTGGTAQPVIGDGCDAEQCLQIEEEPRNLPDNVSEKAIWGGASGASVLRVVGNTAEITSVITEEDPALRKRLKTIPVSAFINDPRFCEHVFPLAPAQAEASKKLFFERAELAFAGLLPELRSRLWDEGRLPDVATVDAAVAYIWSLDVRSALKCLRDLFVDCQGQTAICDSIRGAAYALATARHGTEYARDLNFELSGRVCQSQAASLTSVELAMSAADNRAPDFRKRLADSDLPAGKLRLEEAPEEGRASANWSTYNDIKKRRGTDILDAISRNGGPQQGEVVDYLLDKQDDWVRDGRRGRRREGRNYLAVKAPVDDLEVAAETCRSLVSEIPHIVAVVIDEAKTGDHAKLGGLRSIIPLKDPED